jgi:Mor family transcriptional regulator
MTKFTDNTDPVAVIEQEARAVALSFGMAAPDDVASALVERLMLRLGGDRLYLPKKRTESRARHQEIRARFRGDNVADLAREFGLTARSVRRIVSV